MPVSGQQASDFVENDDNGSGDFDNDDAVFSGTILSGDVYYAQARARATSDFATIPSSGNLAAQPLQ